MGGIDDAAVGSLREALRGAVITPPDAGYDEARSIYNAMIDRRPAVFAQCVDAADVRTAISFAQDTGVELAVRGGGHSGPGLCLVDGGLVLDLSPMRWVRVDPEAGTVQVGGGSVLGDVDHATHAFGRAVPAGIQSTTGIGGLTLGGGHGHLTRKYGLTIDSLVSADVVLADGRCVTASADNHPDLFWALRGGGGNFGVVTSFTFESHPVHTVGVAVTVWPVERTPRYCAGTGNSCPPPRRISAVSSRCWSYRPPRPSPSRSTGRRCARWCGATRVTSKPAGWNRYSQW